MTEPRLDKRQTWRDILGNALYERDVLELTMRDAPWWMVESLRSELDLQNFRIDIARRHLQIEEPEEVTE